MVQLQLAPDNDAEDKAKAENFSWGKASGAENQKQKKSAKATSNRSATDPQGTHRPYPLYRLLYYSILLSLCASLSLTMIII